MSQIYNGTIKRRKLKENQLGILGITFMEFTHFAGNQQWASVPGENREYTQKVALRIHPKSCRISPPKSDATLLSGSEKRTFGA